MSGGDLLFIVAFIILPTAVLVSCIWALILLRRGVLLPERPAPVRNRPMAAASDADEDDDELGLVEETGEHSIVEVEAAAFAPAATSPDVAEPAQDELPPSERTQDLEVWQTGTEGEPEQADVPPATESAQTGTAELVADDSPPPVAVTPEAPAEAFDPLLAPLDELPRDAQPDDQPAAEASEDDGAGQDAPPVNGPRRLPRRFAQPRPASDAPQRPRPRVGQRRDIRRPGDEM